MKPVEIIADIPARTIQSISGKLFKLDARTDVFHRDDIGRWTLVMCDGHNIEPLSEAEVISSCENATNWPAIRSAHFPMHGFHN